MGRWSGVEGGLWPLRTLFLLSGAAGAALLPFFAPLLQGRGLDPEQIGLVLGATSLAGAVATPLWSHLADTRLGAVRVLQLSALTTVMGVLALALAGSALLPVLVAAALMSAGAALPMPARSRLGAVGDVIRSSPRLLPFLGGVFLVSVAGSAAWGFVGLRILGQGGGPFLVGLAAALAQDAQTH